MTDEVKEILGMAQEVIDRKNLVMASQNRRECAAYEDSANAMLSALNTAKKLIDDEAETLNRSYKDKKREARDIKDLMEELKSCKTRVRDHKFDLQREAE